MLTQRPGVSCACKTEASPRPLSLAISCFPARPQQACLGFLLHRKMLRWKVSGMGCQTADGMATSHLAATSRSLLLVLAVSTLASSALMQSCDALGTQAPRMVSTWPSSSRKLLGLLRREPAAE